MKRKKDSRLHIEIVPPGDPDYDFAKARIAQGSGGGIPMEEVHREIDRASSSHQKKNRRAASKKAKVPPHVAKRDKGKGAAAKPSR